MSWLRVDCLAGLVLMAVTALAPGGWAAEGDDPLKRAPSGLLDGPALIAQETFWDNRDVNWFATGIPLFECPDRELQTTWYYRWELVTKHLTYGSPNSGYSFTEFIDRPFWSGTYGAISCPAGHQLYEVRWLRDPVFARDYGRYWLRTPGAQPRNYSTWLADAIWATHQVHPDREYLVDLLPDLVRNYEGWEERHFVPGVGLFWQTGHDDGMEFNINSRQSGDILRGAPGYRPTLNSYLWADALAIARVAELSGDADVAEQYRDKAESLKRSLQEKLWDPERRFFFHLYQRDEEAEGVKVKALSLTHQTGKYAGSGFGRELMGYVPWQFSLPDSKGGFEQAWGKLMSEEGFAADFGPTTVERKDPMFLLKESCCWWSGQSWPYATSQTLKAMANLLQGYDQSVVTPADYYALLSTYSRTHRKEGRPYLAEACHPDTGSFAGHDGYNHSEHYFHSSFNDLIITGLVGLRTRDDDRLELHPLAPAEWDYFALDQVPYRGHLLGICWDRDGKRYGRGAGFRVFADGREIASAATLGPLEAKLPLGSLRPASGERTVNYAVNNDGTYYPRLTTSWSNPHAPASKLVDGNYWYHRDPPNRWTCEGSEREQDWVEIDLGMLRELERVRLYCLDDGTGVVPPLSARVEYWDGAWKVLGELGGEGRPAIRGQLPSELAFPPLQTGKVRLELTHGKGGKSGLTEIELLGRAKLPVETPPHPAGNLANRSEGSEWPKARASHSDRFGGKPELANDGVINFLPTPTNRWTSYESTSERDWLELDFGRTVEFRRIELAIYDDRGGVQAPQSYELEVWDGTTWQPVDGVERLPAMPVGGEVNIARFAPQTASKLRIWFQHAGQARSGVTEVLVWND